MKAFLGLLALVVCGASMPRGEDAAAPDWALRALVRDSTLVIDADIVQPYLYGTVDEFAASYRARVRVRECLLGETSSAELWVTVSARPFDFRSQPTCLASRGRCLLFLRRDGTGLFGTHDLASAQPYGPELVLEVRRLAKDR